MFSDTEFRPFPKMARLSRECIITEKVDGTNACIFIDDEGVIKAGSRTRWVTTKDDNFGFARWVEDHHDELLTLGPGRHFGEWWGKGIQRGYLVPDKRLALFNTIRWCPHGVQPQVIPSSDPRAPTKMQDVLPPCCGLVPVLWRGEFDTRAVDAVLSSMLLHGSAIAPLFKNPEGIVAFHVGANIGFKKTFGGDGHKGAQ